jgi:hypothetical protein
VRQSWEIDHLMAAYVYLGTRVWQSWEIDHLMAGYVYLGTRMWQSWEIDHLMAGYVYPGIRVRQSASRKCRIYEIVKYLLIICSDNIFETGQNNTIVHIYFCE